MGIIKPLSDTISSILPMVFEHCKGKIRVCMKPFSLNKILKRRHYPLNTLEVIAVRLNSSKWLSLLGCNFGRLK